MENQINNLLRSIIKCFPSARFEVINNSFSPTLKHFVIKDSDGAKGFGTDHNYQQAIEKAYSEFIERKTLQQLNNLFGGFKSSNGFSAHKSIIHAKQASCFELIERDAFLNTWHGKIGPYWISGDETKALTTSENLEIINMHEYFKLKLKIGIISKSNRAISCIAKVEGNFKGRKFFYIDTKTGENLSETQNKLIESVSFFSHYIRSGKFISQKQKKSPPIEPIDHFFYYLNHFPSNDWFHKGSSHVLEIPSKKIHSYIVNPSDYLNVPYLNRFVSFSESQEMQSYYTGKFELKNINNVRFKELFGSKRQYNKQVHPLS